jgi:putative hemolysin
MENIWNLYKELKEVKKYKPQIISAFECFDHGEDPKKALEEIINIAKDYPALDKLLKFTKTYNMILRAEENAKKRGGWGYACQEAVKEMGVNYEIRGKENIPVNGKALYISNHPYGLLDGAILVGGLYPLINKKEGQLKIIVMNQARFIEGLEKIAIFVHSTVKGPNIGALRESLKHLDEGGDLAIYPSGRMSKAGLEEYPWENGLGAFMSHSEYVVPMWFSGPNHAKIYNLFAKFKEELRRALSLREVWNKAEKTVILNIGEPIRPEELKLIENPKERVQHLRDIAEGLKVAV